MTNIFYKWTWESKFDSLLLVFYFPCNQNEDSDVNIRVEKCHGSPEKLHEFSWSPKHIEQGMISELLHLANIVNGYKPAKKQELVIRLRKGRHKLNESNVLRHSRMIKEVSRN